MTKAILALSAGRVFEGRSFGYDGEASGEVVFNTSLTGYQEILTDPSYCQQIVIFTNPMIGNYGINEEDIESHKPQVAGLVVKEYCPYPSNWRSKKSLADYLKEHQIVGVEGLPTREIVRFIRDQGAMPGLLAVGDLDPQKWIEKAKVLPPMEGRELVGEVTCPKAYLQETTPKKHYVIAYDFGIKKNIVRELNRRGCQVKVVPAFTPPRDVLSEKPDGVLLSNGPGDPAASLPIIKNIQALIGKVPLMGICLGHQLLSLALGAKSFKLKFGHRGGNQPVKDLESGKIFITSQNHGFAINGTTLPDAMIPTQINLNDQTLEGFRHKEYPILSIQYHPEASPGPHDANSFFDQFIELMNHA